MSENLREGPEAWPDELPFGDVLRRLRLEAELSQEMLAERARISPEAVSALERGTRKTPQRETILRLVEGLELSGERRAAFERIAGRIPRGHKRDAGASDPQLAQGGRPPNNLPLAVTSFIARGEELASIAGLLERTRLLTLTGTAGVGKTRVALQIAATLAERMPDGAWFVDLAPLGAPSLVVSALATTLSIASSGNPSLADVLAYLKHKRLLLILDNCEHVVFEAARVADAILRGCEHVTLLATSRESLNVLGERLFRVPSLGVPPAGEALSAGRAMDCGAVRLFAERASAADARADVSSRFVLDEQNVRPVVEICRRLDGIPLAIELAAARVRTLSVETIEAKLEERFELLKGGSRTSLPRQQTLRAAIDWSYALLAENEQRIFEWLSIFAGYPTLEVLTSVCIGASRALAPPGDLTELEVLDLVSSLADKSLVEVVAAEDETRYGLLNSMRRYGRERLHERAHAEAASGAHARAMLELAEELDRAQAATPDGEWYARVAPELDDWRLALAWALEQRHDVALGQRLAGALQHAWTNSRDEGHRWIRAALASVETATPLPAVARLELADAYCTLSASRYAEALPAALRAREAYERLGDPFGIAWSYDLSGLALVSLGRFAEGEADLEQALSAARGIGADKLEGYVLQDLALSHQLRGDLTTARRLHAQTFEIFERTGDERAAVVAIDHLSDLEHRAGDSEAALRLAREALASNLRLGRFRSAAETSCNVVAYLIALERYDEAAAAAREAILLSRDLGDDALIAVAVQHVAAVEALRPRAASARGDAARAARLFGFADRQLAAHPMRFGAGAEERRRVRAALEEELGAERFAALTSEGAQLNPERALKEVTGP